MKIRILLPSSREGLLRRTIPRLAPGRLIEIAAKGFERTPLFIYLRLRPDAQCAEHRQRWTPTLQCVLQQESADGDWQQNKPAIHQNAERRTDDHRAGRIRFEPPLDVPFFVEFLQPLIDGCPSLTSQTSDTLISLLPDPLVVFVSRVGRNAINRTGEIGRGSHLRIS